MIDIMKLFREIGCQGAHGVHVSFHAIVHYVIMARLRNKKRKFFACAGKIIQPLSFACGDNLIPFSMYDKRRYPHIPYLEIVSKTDGVFLTLEKISKARIIPTAAP